MMTPVKLDSETIRDALPAPDGGGLDRLTPAAVLALYAEPGSASPLAGANQMTIAGIEFDCPIAARARRRSGASVQFKGLVNLEDFARLAGLSVLYADGFADGWDRKASKANWTEFDWFPGEWNRYVFGYFDGAAARSAAEAAGMDVTVYEPDDLGRD